MSESYPTYRFIYNLLTSKTLPRETYRTLINKTLEVGLSSTKTEYNDLQIKPKKVKQVLFLFIGPLNSYVNDGAVDISKIEKILKEVQNFVKAGNKYDTFKKKNIKSLDSFFKQSTINTWDIEDVEEVWFIQHYITSVDRISDIHAILEVYITETLQSNSSNTIPAFSSKIKTNKLLLYANNDLVTNRIIIDNIKRNIITEYIENSSITIEDLKTILYEYNVPKMVIAHIKQNPGEDISYSLEFLEKILNNPLIDFFLNYFIQYRCLSYDLFYPAPQRFKKRASHMHTNIHAYLESDTIFTQIPSIENNKLSNKSLDQLTKERTFYFYNYDNINHYFNNKAAMKYCFPLYNKTFELTTPNILTPLFNIYNNHYNKPSSLTGTVTNISMSHVCIISQTSNLRNIFNNSRLSYNVPFIKYNDRQGDDKIYKVFKKAFALEGDYYIPQINKEELISWVDTSNYIAHDNGRDEIILMFKIKLDEVPSENSIEGAIKYIYGDYYDILTKVGGENKIFSRIPRRFIKTLKGKKASVSDLSIHTDIKFHSVKAIYASVMFTRTKYDGKTTAVIQFVPSDLKINSVNKKLLDIYIPKLNEFFQTFIYGSKYYTNEFTIAYSDLNMPLVNPSLYYEQDSFNIDYKYNIENLEPCISIIKTDGGISEIIKKDIAWTKLIKIFSKFSNFIVLDNYITDLDINDKILYFNNDIWKGGIIINKEDDDTFTIKIGDEEIKEVGIHELRKAMDNPDITGERNQENIYIPTKNELVFFYRSPDNYKNRVIIDYYSTNYKIKCSIKHVRNIHILNTICNFINFCFKQYDSTKHVPKDVLFKTPYYELLQGKDLTSIEDSTTVSPDKSVEIESVDIQSNIVDDDEEEILSDDSDDDDSDGDSSDDSDTSTSESESQLEDSGETDDDEISEEEDEYSTKVTSDKPLVGTSSEETIVPEIVTGIVSPPSSLMRASSTFVPDRDTYQSFLDRLYEQDPILFKWSTPGFGQYPRICQAGRKPKVLTQEQKDKVDTRDAKTSVNSYGLKLDDKNCKKEGNPEIFYEDNKPHLGVIKKEDKIRCKSIKYGSSKTNQRWYICPRIYDKKTNEPIHFSLLKYRNPQKMKAGWLDYGVVDSFESTDETDENLWRIDKKTGTLDILDFTPRLASDDGDEDRIWIYPIERVAAGGPYFYPGFNPSEKHPLSATGEEPLYPICCFRGKSFNANKVFFIEDSIEFTLTEDSSTDWKITLPNRVSRDSIKNIYTGWKIKKIGIDTNAPEKVIKYNSVATSARNMTIKIERETVTTTNPKTDEKSTTEKGWSVNPQKGDIFRIYNKLLSKTSSYYQNWSENSGPLVSGSYGVMSESISLLLGNVPKFKGGLQAVIFKKGKEIGYFFRKGITHGKFNNPNEDGIDSFLFLMENIYKPNSPIEINDSKDMKTKIIDSLTIEDPPSDTLINYEDINNGFLNILFKINLPIYARQSALGRNFNISFKNFLEYTLSNELKRYDFYYEICTQMGKLNEYVGPGYSDLKSIGLIIFDVDGEDPSQKIKILCPYFSKYNDDYSHIALAIRYTYKDSKKNKFEPIFLRYQKSGGSSTDKKRNISLFNRSDIDYVFGQEHNTIDTKKRNDLYKKLRQQSKDEADEEKGNVLLDRMFLLNYDNGKYIQSIGRLINVYTNNCEKIEEEHELKLTFKKLIEFLSHTTIKNTLKIKRLLIDSYSKIYGIQLVNPDPIQRTGKSRTARARPRGEGGVIIPVYPEHINYKYIKSIGILKPIIKKAEWIKSQNEKQLKSGKIIVIRPKEQELSGIDKYIEVYNYIKQNSTDIDIKIHGYFGNEHVNEVRGIITSYILGDIDSGELRDSMVYIETKKYTDTELNLASNLNIKTDVISKGFTYDYSHIDRVIINAKNKEFTENISDPIDILKRKTIGASQISFLEQHMDDLNIKTMYYHKNTIRDIKKIKNIIMIETNEGIFIPIKPVDEDILNREFLRLKGTGYKKINVVKFNQADIKIIPDNILTYCDNLIQLNKKFNVTVPIFIKGFKLENKKIVAVYLNSGIFIEGHLENIFIKIVGGFPIDQLNIIENDFAINIIRRKNVDYLVDYEINSDSLDIRNPFKQLVRFEYDSKISEVLLYSISNFLQYSMFKHNVVSDIKKFIKKIITNTSINEYKKHTNMPVLHRFIKRRMLYPLLFLVLDIISFRCDRRQCDDYPEINIETLFNSCNANIQQDTKNIVFEAISIDELDNMEGYIKKSFDYLIEDPLNKTRFDTILDQLPDFEKELYEEGFQLYNKLVRSIGDKKICRLKIYSGDDDNRYRIIRYKILENILFNQYIRSQLFNTYIFKNDIDYKCVKSTELLMFSQKGVVDTGEYDALYDRVSTKFYRQIHYLEDTQNKNIEKHYTFKYIIK